MNPIAQAWFGYKGLKIGNRTGTFRVEVLSFLPILAGSLNVVFLFGIIGYLLLNGYKEKISRKGLLLITALWSVNFGFSVFASPIALRFQLFPIITSITFASLFIEYIARMAKQREIKSPAMENDTTRFELQT